jgi:hypothetical protein
MTIRFECLHHAADAIRISLILAKKKRKLAKSLISTSANETTLSQQIADNGSEIHKRADPVAPPPSLGVFFDIKNFIK